MLKRARALALIAIVAIVLAGCTIGQAPDTPLTPLEKAKKTATWINDTYATQYDDYEATVKLPNLTEAQKQILRTKYQVLQEADPLIGMFNQAVDDGLVPSPELERQIMDLLTRLQTATTQ